jgi:hypothetical protein
MANNGEPIEERLELIATPRCRLKIPLLEEVADSILSLSIKWIELVMV